MADKKKVKSLAEILKDKKKLISLGVPSFEWERIPFTSPRLNAMTHGGIPVGKFTEFNGDQHSGKTTTALDIIANYQNGADDRPAMFVDVERSLDPVWATKLGVNMDKLYMFVPDVEQSGEEVLQVVLDIMKTGEIGLIIFDSVGALVPAQAYEKDLTDRIYCGIANAMTTFCGEAIGYCNTNKVTFIELNQYRDKIGSMFGGVKVPGGRALSHALSCKFSFRKGTYYDSKGGKLSSNAEHPAAQEIVVSMDKNKTCSATTRVSSYTLDLLNGVDYINDLIDVGIENDIILKTGGWYTITDTETGEILLDKTQGRDKVKLAIMSDIQMLTKLEKMVNDSLKNDSIMEVEEDGDEL